MPDLFGGLISVPEPTVVGVLPYLRNLPATRQTGYQYAVHKITDKKEQRILTKNRPNVWSLTGRPLYSSTTVPSDSELDELYTFYDAHRSPMSCFYFYDPVESSETYDLTGAATTGRYVCRFADGSLDARAFRDRLHESTVDIKEVNVSTSTINFGWLFETLGPYRHPYPGDDTMANLQKAQLTGDTELVHIVNLRPVMVEEDAFVVRVSDRRCQVSHNFGINPTDMAGLYLPMLLGWDVTQELGAGDQATFWFDDSTRVWFEYLKQYDFNRAVLKFVVNLDPSTYAIALWKGWVYDWSWEDRGRIFRTECRGGISQLEQVFPTRTFASVCPLEFDDDGECNYDAFGSGGDPVFCDRSLEGAQGCVVHGMTNSFQGMVVKVNPAFGFLPGTFGRGDSYSSPSTPLKSAYGAVIPVIYGIGRQIVEATLFEWRHESEFLSASGFFSEGPIGEVGQVLLDGQTQHLGFSPVVALGTLRQDVGTQIDSTFRSSRLAFACVRRTDEIGFKNPNEPHKMLVEVLEGVEIMQIWRGGGASAIIGRNDFLSSNPVHIAFDIVVRTLNLRHHPWVDGGFLNTICQVDTYTAAAGYCADSVTKLVGGGSETRFAFLGQIRDQKPAIDHMREVLANTPIDLVYSAGRLSFKVRKNDIAAPPPEFVVFAKDQNIILDSFKAERYKPEFNHLSILFSDSEYDFNPNEIAAFDKEAQKRIGFAQFTTERKPFVLKKQIKLNTVTTRSQASRLATQLLREELGGKTQSEQLNARLILMKAPLVGLAVEVGDVSLVVHADLPFGQAYVRWHSWRYSSDRLEVELKGKTVVESMYTAELTQTPSTMTGASQPGIPGGSQGSDGTENQPATLTAPVLQVLSEGTVGIVGVSPPPLLTNWIVIEEEVCGNVSSTA